MNTIHSYPILMPCETICIFSCSQEMMPMNSVLFLKGSLPRRYWSLHVGSILLYVLVHSFVIIVEILVLPFCHVSLFILWKFFLDGDWIICVNILQRGPAFIEELLSVIPNAHYYKRGTYDLRKVLLFKGWHGVWLLFRCEFCIRKWCFIHLSADSRICQQQRVYLHYCCSH